MTNSTHLIMPFIEAAQAQKHVTHNTALQILDAIIMLAILDRDLTSPPISPNEGDRYLVGSSAAGSWGGHDGKIAVWQDGTWTFHTPSNGWVVWIADEEILLVFDGVSWIGSATQNAAFMGINTTADSNNRLAVSSEAVLLNNAGNDIQLKLNKNTSSDKSSIVFQTGFSGRTEIGCLGNEDFTFKTSLDGLSFHTGLTLRTEAQGVPQIPSFTVSQLPTASLAGAGSISYVSDAIGGATLAFSDGSDWRRSTDRSIVN